MNNLIKIALAILFFLCLAPMPYVYYQFVRIVAMLGFAYLAFDSNKEGRQTEMIMYIGLAILFQPLIKIALGRTLWNVVDVIVGIGLVVSVIKGNAATKKIDK